jgi:hypothetical protein
MTDDEQWAYAPAKTLHGALQRGSGRAAVWVAAHRTESELPELVYDCMRRDYRWDGVDERTVYLARLVIDLGLSLDPIVERVSRAGRHTRTFDQGVDVLKTLAKAHFPGAADALREHTPAPVEYPPTFHRECPSLPYRDLPATALLNLLADPDTPTKTLSAASHEFDHHRDPEPRLLDIADELLTHPNVRGSLFRALEKLGPRTVRLARGWVGGTSRPLWWRAIRILTEHGDITDVPALLAAFDRLDADTNDWCGYSELAGGLARLGVTDIAPRLRSLWRHSPHTYERAGCVKALLVLDPDATRERLPDALSDCESDVRLLAAQHTPLTSEAIEGLSRLRADTIESNEVREAAATRLSQG